jgi:hypothetical protein
MAVDPDVLRKIPRSHFTIRLRRADDAELGRLLAAFGDLRPNPQYAEGGI